MPSKLSFFLQGTAVTSFAGLCTFIVSTKHAQFEPLDPSTDRTFASPSFRKFNPNHNPTFHDLYTRKIPLAQLDPKLRQDAINGGDALVTRFSQGVLGGFAYTPQRRILALTNKSETTKDQLWTKRQILQSNFEQGTDITDHFRVVERPDSQTVVIRGGTSPLVEPDGPREQDALFEFQAKADFDAGFAEFKLKSICFQGTPKVDQPPFGQMSVVGFLHRQYAKLLLETAVAHCKEDLTSSLGIDWDMVTGKVLFQGKDKLKEKLDELEGKGK